jgi:peptidoglycan/xylan/chitin deacetylase (PgdA/CDA1 family)
VSLFLPILMYHQIRRPGTDDKPDLCVPPATFREHMDYLSDRGFRAVGPDALLSALTEGKPPDFPELPVMITFDDADARGLAPALAALAERSWPAVGYFVAGQTESLPPPDQVCDLQRAGFAVGSHCLTHRRLTKLSDEALGNELVEGRKRLEVRMGAPVVHLAYPFGAFGRREMAAAREAGYRTAMTVQRGNRHCRRDLFRLRRLPIRPDTTPRRLRRYLGRAWHLEHVTKEKLGLDRRGNQR